MATLTISEAARTCHVARSTLQRAVQAGRLSLNPDHRVDTAELLRAGYALHAALPRASAATRQDAAGHAADMRQGDAAPVAPALQHLQAELALLTRERDLLHAALAAAAAREQQAQDREARLLHLLEQVQAQSQRLLDVARPPLAPPAVAPAPRPPAYHRPRPQAAAGPAFDTTKYVLGKLCPRGHAYADTGQSLLWRRNRVCPACDRERTRARRHARRRSSS